MAAEEARRRGHSYIGMEHLMLAIVVEGKSVPARVLARRATLTELRSDLEEAMAGYERPV